MTRSYFPGLTQQSIPYLESVKAASFGDSYGNNPSQGADANTLWVNRIVARNRMQAVSQFAVAGTRMDQVLAAIKTSWTPNGRGLVFFADGTINDEKQYLDDIGANTTAEAFRSCLAYLTSWAVSGMASSALNYGPGWTSGTTSTAGAYVDVAFTGQTGCILVTYATDAGGVLSVKNTAGATIATISTGGYKNAFTGVVTLTNQGEGTHTVRVALTSGTATVEGVLVPGTNVPTIVWLKPGQFNSSATEFARLKTYLAACTAMLPLFPTVIAVDVNSGWDYTTMVAADNTHPNDRGVTYYTDLTQAALRRNIRGFREGLNWLKAASGFASSGPYTIPTAAYVGPGATAPAAPTGLAAPTTQQFTVAWTKPVDNGSTITSYVLQSSPTGAGTWTTSANPLGTDTSYVFGTGFTQGSVYDFRIAAVNSIGQSAYSAIATGTAGPPLVVLASDDFTRADSATLGVTPVGAKTWVPAGPTTAANASALWGITGNTAICNGANAANGGADAFVDMAVADGTLTARFTSVTSGGLIFRTALAGGLTVNGYIAWANGANYNLSSRAGGNYTFIAASVGVTPTAGDLVSVVMSGSSIKVRVNGVTVITATSALYTGTRHGLWSQSSGRIFDDFQFTNGVL